MVLKKIKLGVMQGRLLPKYQGRYQAHPVGYWQEEFPIAAACGLDCIEFILDYREFEKNPLIFSNGINEIKQMIEQTKVQVKSICADYFMESSFTQPDKKKVQNSIDILNHLIDVAPSLGVENIVIPCVDQSSLNSPEKQSLFVEYVSSSLALAEKNKVNLALETDLGPKEFKHLLNCFHSPNLTVNYDIGNSASLGFNIEDELITYGSKITDIHIKDRTLNGGSIFLGNGNADFKKFYQLLSKIKYQGIFVMQVYRDDEGLDIFKKQLNWILPILEEYEMKTFYGK